MDGPVSRDARNPEASPLRWRDIVGQGSDMIEGDHGKFCGCAKGPIRLGAVAPDSAAHPLGRYSLADLLDLSGAITVRNDAWVGHA